MLVAQRRRYAPPTGRPHIYPNGRGGWTVRMYRPFYRVKAMGANNLTHAFFIAKSEYEDFAQRRR